MRTVISILSTVLLAATAIHAEPRIDEPEPAPSAPYYNTLAEAEQAATDDQKIVIDFYTDWCMYCKMLDTAVFTDPSVIDFFTDEMLLVKINAEVDTALANHYHVLGYPTGVLVDRHGVEVDRLIGYEPAQDYMDIMRGYAEGKGTLADLENRYADQPDRPLAFEIGDKYKYRGDTTDAETWYDKVISLGQPTDSLSGEAQLARSDMFRRTKDYPKAVKGFAAMMQNFAGTRFAEIAEFYRAYTLQSMKDTDGAIKAYEGFIDHYPTSEDVDYARDQIEKLQNEGK